MNPTLKIGRFTIRFKGKYVFDVKQNTFGFFDLANKAKHFLRDILNLKNLDKREK